MTNYNERLNDLTSFMESIGWEFDENGYTFEDNYINFRTANMLRQAIIDLHDKQIEQAYSDGFRKAAKGAFKSQQAAKREAVEEVLDRLESMAAYDPSGSSPVINPRQIEAERNKLKVGKNDQL